MIDSIDDILSYMKINVFAIHSIERLAGEFGYSKYHFSRMFKHITGFSAQNYLTAIKLERSIEELTAKQSSVLHSHLASGYLSAGTFSGNFKKHTGLSPKQYQKRLVTLFSLLQEYQMASTPQETAYHDSLLQNFAQSKCEVTLEYPDGYLPGIAFVGLFKTPIPDHKPIVGKAITNCRHCILHNIPKGSFYLLACSVEKSKNPVQYFVLKDCLRGRIDEVLAFPDEDGHSFRIKLRPPIPQDPPILINLPQLLSEVWKRE